MAPFPLRAYSEFMPPPWVGVKPYAPARTGIAGLGGDDFEISEYERAHELERGLARIGEHVVRELGALMRGSTHALSRTILDGNPAWPDELAKAAIEDDPIALLLPVALSRTQDDLGNVRWTLFGASHEGPEAAFWRSVTTPRALGELLAWLGVGPDVRILGDAPAALRHLCVDDADRGTLVTFRPFAALPARVRAAYLARELALVPCPASLIFFHHAGYLTLAKALPHAMQIPLLHLFPRIEASCTIRVPQSGWLDETGGGGHRVVDRVRRTHRWERVERDERDGADNKFTDKVSTALFSTDPDVIGLYDKPMARNAQIWSEAYELLLDGPRADRAAIDRARAAVDRGGRFGYRFVFPPMRAGLRALYWHLPVVARAHEQSALVLPLADGPKGFVTAERDGAPAIVLAPRLADRPAHYAAATQYEREPGRARYTTSHNARKLLELRDLVGESLPPSFARASLRIPRAMSVEQWLAALPADADDRAAGARLATALRETLAPPSDDDPGAPITLEASASRAFEEGVWRRIAELSEGEWRQKENGDGIDAAVNRGKHGGPAAKKAKLHVSERRDLEALGDHLRALHRQLIEKHGMTGRAQVIDHAFAWETDFDYPWMHGWAKNREAPSERNLVVVIPGRDRGEAVIMGDHYDTAYMEDVYDPDRGGDGLRAPAAGADDNCSASTALLAAADALLPLARDGKLLRDVWLVHLTGEEFPADSLGARAIVQALVEGGVPWAPQAIVTGAYILDMVGHNNDKHKDVFQISPGEGAASARLALHAHRATERWNRLAAARNARDRAGLARAARMPNGAQPPPPFAHLALRGEVRVEWEPRSSLYNTDGQVFSDCGVPVVLFMENYDIDRTGYHDTLDTMANIDLDYCAAVIAIAIESVAIAAMTP